MTVGSDQNPVTLKSIVVAGENQVSAELVGEAVILNLHTGTYYGLNPIGADIWQFIKTPQQVNAVCAYILEEYEVDTDRCQHDVLNLLNDLAANGLIEVKLEVNG